MSVAELYRWTEKRNWSRGNVRDLERMLGGFVVLSYDNDLAWAWARLTAACERGGRPIPTADAWIAATAIRHDLPLLTNNTRHFAVAAELCGLRLADA